MDIMIDVKRLRSDLENYFGTGVYAGMLHMMTEVWDIKESSDEEVIRLAQREHFDMYKYEI